MWGRRAVSANGVRRVYRILCNLAWCDGEVDPRELDYLATFRAKHGISEAEAEELRAEGERQGALKLSKNADEQALLAESMLGLAAADGVVAPAERKKLDQLAKVVGLELSQLAAERVNANLPKTRVKVSLLASGDALIALPSFGVTCLLRAGVASSIGLEAESLDGKWAIASMDEEWRNTAPRERYRFVTKPPKRWKACFKEHPNEAFSTLAGAAPRYLRALFTVIEDMGYSAWAYGLSIELRPDERTIRFEESVDTE
jgi:tellurite resistance protein TerB